MKRIILALYIVIASFVLIPAVASTAVYAQFDPLDETCENSVNADDAQSICEASATPTDPINGDDGIITTAANVLALVASIIAVFVIVIAGITMMTSQGDAGKITASRNAIIYTVIGLVVIVIARTFVVYIFGELIG